MGGAHYHRDPTSAQIAGEPGALGRQTTGDVGGEAGGLVELGETARAPTAAAVDAGGELPAEATKTGRDAGAAADGDGAAAGSARADDGGGGGEE